MDKLKELINKAHCRRNRDARRLRWQQHSHPNPHSNSNSRHY
jgi:hypothetical protein